MSRLRFLFLVLVLSGSTPALANPGMVQVGVGAALSYGNVPQVGLDLDYNINPMFSVGFGLLSGAMDFTTGLEDVIEDEDEDFAFEVEEATVGRSLALATAKFYPFMGSFNVGVAAGPGVTVAKLKVASDDTDEKIEETYTYQQTVAALTIGNTWRWQHFYVGFDWVGYMGMLSSSKETESKSTEIASAAFTEAFGEFEDIAKIFGEQGGPIMLAFRIGTGF